MVCCTSLLAVIVALVVVVVSYFKWKFQYWKKKNLPYTEPTIPFGNLPNLIQRTQSIQERLHEIHQYFRKRGFKHGGFYFFTTPSYMPVDPEYIKNILTKDFSYFTDRGMYHNEKDDPLSAHLFAIGGIKWRNLRVKITPTFTTGKMRGMFSTLVDCGKAFKQMMDQVVQENTPLNIKDLTARFTSDVIGSCAFGLECHTIAENDSPFIGYAKKILNTTVLQNLRLAVGFANPNLARFLRFKVTPEDVTQFFTNVVNTTVDYRDMNDYRRNDFLQILVDLKNNKLDGEIIGEHDGKRLTMDELAAQCFVFFLAGYETSSTLLTFTMLELCKNPNIQEKVRDEINTVLEKHNGKITYDGIMEMKYVQQTLDESLRLYPPLSVITRECVKDYRVPDTDVVIEKGTICWISLLGLHHDEEHYPNPKVFDPDRFSEENKNSRHQYAFLPFGEGPRVCIGLRFGYMQAKVALTFLLKNYRFSLDSQTKLPIEMDPTSIVTSAKDGVWLKAERIGMLP